METQLIDNCMKLGFGMMRLPKVEGKAINLIAQISGQVERYEEFGVNEKN